MDSFIIILLIVYFFIKVCLAYRTAQQLNILVFAYSIYLVISLFSLLLYNHPNFYNRGLQITLLPFLYFIIFFEITLYPIKYISRKKVLRIIPPNKLIFYSLTIFSVLISVLCLPSMISGFKTGILGIMTDNTMFKDIYVSNQLGLNSGSGSNLPSVFQSVLGYISILMLFYYFTLEHKKLWIVISLLFSILILPGRYIASADRTGLVTFIFSLIGSFLLFRKFYTSRFLKYVKLLLYLPLVLIVVVIVAITFSRFTGDELSYSIYSYLGQPLVNFNLYCLDAGGDRNGDRVFSMIKGFINPNAAVSYEQRISKYSHLSIDESYFVTYIGDIVLDFGPIIAVILALLFFLLLKILIRYSSSTYQYPFHNYVLIFIVLCMITEGWSLYRYGDISGNVRLFGLVILYFIFKIFSSRPSDSRLDIHS